MNDLFSCGERDLPFTEHLEELRWRIIGIIAIFFFLCGIVFFNMDRIIALFMDPVNEYGIELYYFRPHEKLFTCLKIAIVTGMVLVIPFALVQLGFFLYPGLRKEEFRILLWAGVLIPLLFCTGVLFSWQILSPAVFRFFLNFSAGDRVLPLWGFGAYFSFLTGILLAGGVVFQMPLVVFLLVWSGLLSATAMSRIRGIVFLVCALIGALLSPPDVLSQVMLALPLYFLFEVSLGICVLREKIKERSEAEG